LKTSKIIVFLTAILGAFSCSADQYQEVFYLNLPISETKALGQIDKLVVTVNCSWVSGLKKVPELYDIQMGYDLPTQNILTAEPRLGAAAVDLSKWNNVIGIHLPSDADSKSCFKVTVVVEGRLGVRREWDGVKLGLPK
jgi:hypothetical protein